MSTANEYVESKLFVKQVGNSRYDITRYRDYRKVTVGYGVSLKEAVSYAQWHKLEIVRLRRS